jgi:ClpP class serine protease
MANDVGTLLFGPEAMEIGLIDEIGSLHSALQKLRELADLKENSIDKNCKEE